MIDEPRCRQSQIVTSQNQAAQIAIGDGAEQSAGVIHNQSNAFGVAVNLLHHRKQSALKRNQKWKEF